LALSEFVAMETAYLALEQLDPGARQRALHWLTDALSVGDSLPKAPGNVGSEPNQNTPTPQSEPRRRPRVSAPTRRTAKAASPAATPAAKAATGKAIAGKATAGKATVGRAAAGTGERAYRRMPEASDVLAAYQQVGSVSGLADHYGVPRHTVQGWARRLRREGYDIGRTA
jgi:hypothetical protein